MPRWRAALRTPSLPCGHRDPIFCITAPSGPSTYSLDVTQLAAERARLLAAGWTPAEVTERLATRQAMPA
ncbi:hypothetical protein J7E89_14900 [Streptomyces sp. ISL-100]|nr:hypothetical protein [Streptomyces sp. ISL-100]